MKEGKLYANWTSIFEMSLITLSKSNVEGNKLNSIDHTFPHLLLGSNDKELNTSDPRPRLS
jgi:hypothetical protein